MKYLAIIAVVAATALCSCEGRTSRNMVPAGDTVEVVINQQEEAAEAAADSMAIAAHESEAL